MREQQLAWASRLGALARSTVLAATSVVVLGATVLLAVVHVHDRYFVNHVSGHWMTLARYVHDGKVYPPLFDGTHTFGTFYMPLPFLASGALSLVTGEYLVSGKLTAYATALALFGLMFVLLRRAGCSRLVSSALVSAVLVTPAGYLAAVSIRGDALSVVFELAALAVVTRGVSRRRLLAAAALCALAIASKSTAVWAPAAILVWTALRDRRAALEFAGAVVGLTALILGVVDVASGGRFWQNISTFALSQPKDPGATPLSGASTLVHLNFLDRDGIWLLFPFALLAGAFSLRRRELSLFQVALVVDMLILVVVLRDVGADYNHLLDLSVLTALVVGELWARPRLSPRATAMLTAALTVALVVGAASAFTDTISPDLALGARMAVGDASGALYSTHPLRGIVPAGATILSEDPSLPILSGQLPVTDPLMLSRMEKSHPAWIAQLRRRIDEKQFDDVVLIRPLEPGSFHASVSFGNTITEAIARNYRPARIVPTGSLTYYLYVPR
jgi:hypothetical protein